MNSLDRKIIALLAQRKTEIGQAEIAKALDVRISLVYASLMRLSDAGLVTLRREGVRHFPRLAVYTEMETAMQTLEAAVCGLVDEVIA